jgi:hypothetical protein
VFAHRVLDCVRVREGRGTCARGISGSSHVGRCAQERTRMGCMCSVRARLGILSAHAYEGGGPR